MLRAATVAVLLAFAGCVVHYGQNGETLGPATPQAPPSDFEQVEARLEALIDATDDADRLDRLQAAHDLARRVKQLDAASQRVALAYLRELVAIEERSRPIEAPVLYERVEAQVAPLLVEVHEEELDWEAPPEAPEGPPPEEESAPPPAGEPAPATTDAQAPPEPPADEPSAPPPTELDPTTAGEPSADDVEVAGLLAAAEKAMAAGTPEAAMTVLEECRQKLCWEAVADEWVVARDAYVHKAREEAGKQYLAARNETDPQARAQSLMEVRQRLADLVDRYPDCRYAGAIRRNVDLVQRELEATLAESP